ncbi:uncharacterized protein PHACADRAFT_213229, partial [Phanerochaete carnosa HHB-10118-sp]
MKVQPRVNDREATAASAEVSPAPASDELLEDHASEGEPVSGISTRQVVHATAGQTARVDDVALAGTITDSSGARKNLSV